MHALDEQVQIGATVASVAVFNAILHFLSVQFVPHALAPWDNDKLATGSSIPSHPLKERHAYADP